MMDLSAFIVRISGRRANTYYIDCTGLYRVEDISKASGINVKKLREIYSANGGVLNDELGVYYFDSIAGAKNTIAGIMSAVSGKYKGRSIFLTENEIEYLRRALIANDGITGTDSRMVDAVLKKFNQ